MHYRAGGSTRFLKFKKWSEVDTCLSFNQARNFALFEMVMNQNLHKKCYFFLKANMAKIMASVEKVEGEGRGAQLRLVFCMVKI